jgi:hypothetical protein
MEETTTTSVAVERTGPAPLIRIGLVGVAAAALIAVGILAAGASAAPAGTLASDTGTRANTTAAGDYSMGGRRGGFGFGGITITAISGSNLSLETLDGWTRTITVDSGTTYSKSGDTIALPDLEVGDEIRFKQTREDDGSFTIDAIAVIPPHVGGTVTAVSGSTITVEQKDGTSATIKVTSSTTYQVNGDGATLSDVKVEMVVLAEGTLSSDGTLTATAVRAGNHDGPGFGRRGFRGMGPDGGWDGTNPDATAAPEASAGAS